MSKNQWGWTLWLIMVGLVLLTGVVGYRAGYGDGRAAEMAATIEAQRQTREAQEQARQALDNAAGWQDAANRAVKLLENRMPGPGGRPANPAGG